MTTIYSVVKKTNFGETILESLPIYSDDLAKIKSYIQDELGYVPTSVPFVFADRVPNPYYMEEEINYEIQELKML